MKKPHEKMAEIIEVMHISLVAISETTEHQVDLDPVNAAKSLIKLAKITLKEVRSIYNNEI